MQYSSNYYAYSNWWVLFMYFIIEINVSKLDKFNLIVSIQVYQLYLYTYGDLENTIQFKS
ncbi:hypothetical protein bcgnr5380_23590 [Bacillus cereus]